MASPLIALRNASVAHADGLPPALHDVSLTIDRGDWIAVAGDNGSGKTTLLAALGGALPLGAGSLERASGLRVALLLQDPDNQLVASSVRRELALSVPRDVDAPARERRINAAIDRFELGQLLDRNPHRLSGGEKQRLAFATVWLESPDVLLLDEPLSYLDREMRERVVGFARELNTDGAAIVWATPGGEDVALARDVIVLDNGSVTYRGAASGARSQGLARTSPDRFAPPAAEATALPDHMARGPSAPPARARTLLHLENVSFSYENDSVFRDLSLEVREGECVSVTGRNGSGKSTLLLLAGGALLPSRGRVVRDAREHGVLYLPQSPERLFFAETVMEEISFGLERRGVARAVSIERATAALAHASLDPGELAARSPFELSFGEMRRVAFAIAFALEPEILLLDEPASGLDAGGIAVLDDLVRNRALAGAAVVVAAHDEAPSLDYDRVLVLGGGPAAGHPPEGAVDGRHPPG